ncbi:unnamed protein product [Closterium sp. NIES-54]
MSQSLELNQRHHVMHLLPEVDCGPKAWTVLKELHAPTSVVATLMLERELSALRLSEGEPVQPVLDKMRDLYANGLSLPQNQSLWTLEWVRTKILEEDFRRRQLRGGDDGSSGYGMQGSKRGRGRGFGGAGRGAKKDDDSNDQQGGTGWGRGAKSGRVGKSGAGGKMKGSCWYCEKEGHPWFLCYKKPDGWTPQNRHQDGGARRNQKNGANMVADSSDNNPKSNGGAEKKKERTAGQFFHIGEQGEQGDASAKVGAELHPLDYRVLDTGAAWTMTPRKELLDDVRAAPINEVCSASGHALKVVGAGRAAFKGADGKPVVLHDVLLVPDLKANLISLRKLAKAGVSTSTDGARTYKGQLGNRVLGDLHESKDVYRSMWQLPALAWHGGRQAGEGSASQGECNAVGGVGVKVSARSGETDWATAHRRLGHVAMPLLKQLEKDGAVKVWLGRLPIHVAAAGVGVARWGAGWRGVCIPGGVQRRWRGWCEGVGQIWGDRLGNGTPTLGATAGITYPEQTKCLKMLSLLPESWLQFTSGLSLPQNQSLWTLEWVRTKILEEDFRRRQLRGGDDGSSGYGMQGSKRGRGRGFGGARRGAKKDDDSNDQQGGTGWGRGAKSGRGGKSGARAK